MKPDIALNPVVKKLLRLKKKYCPQSTRWHITATYWDDGDYELTLRTSWGNSFHNFIYRHSLEKYYYDNEHRSTYDKYEELR